MFEQGALEQEQVYINGGQRGLQLRLKPADVRNVLKVAVAGVVA
ncbi:hypothetical protein ACRQ5Q_41625 (plasmid) [Bradyrhizobium sp. PMVTL-01]